MPKHIFWTLILFWSVYAWSREPISPLPLKIEYDKEKAALGKKLFSDPALSKDGSVSCATCHNLQAGGADHVRFAIGIEGKKGEFNTPTVYNSRYNFRQFWDGRAKDLKEQAVSPIVNPVEMGNSIEALLKTLETSEYKAYFEQIYGDGIRIENVVDALSEFEKALVTVNAPFDRYLRGDENAISEEAKRGYALFKSKGCVSCHHGISVGGNHFNKFGIMEKIEQSHPGRFNVTLNESDKFYFKVPSLRNVALTAPYFHDGRSETLYEAVKLMSFKQLGRHMEDEELRAIVAFLKTLTGEIPDIAQ